MWVWQLQRSCRHHSPSARARPSAVCGRHVQLDVPSPAGCRCARVRSGSWPPHTWTQYSQAWEHHWPAKSSVHKHENTTDPQNPVFTRMKTPLTLKTQAADSVWLTELSETNCPENLSNLFQWNKIVFTAKCAKYLHFYSVFMVLITAIFVCYQEQANKQCTMQNLATLHVNSLYSWYYGRVKNEHHEHQLTNISANAEETNNLIKLFCVAHTTTTGLKAPQAKSGR